MPPNSVEIALGRGDAKVLQCSGYDIESGIKISGDEIKESKEEMNCVKQEGRWLALSVGASLHIFDLSAGAEKKETKIFDGDVHVACLEFLPGYDAIFVILSNGESYTCSIPLTQLAWRKHDSIAAVVSLCEIAIARSPNGLEICVLDASRGNICIMGNSATNDSSHGIGTIKLRSSVQAKIAPASFLISTLAGFLFFPRRKGSWVRVLPLPDKVDIEQMEDLFQLDIDILMARCIGRLVAVLADNNQLIFYDMNFIRLYNMDIQVPKQLLLLDFQFLDVPELGDWTVTGVKQLLLKLGGTGGSHEYAIYNLHEQKLSLNVLCSSNALLLPFSTPCDEPNILYVDTSVKENRQKLVVNFVREAQPSLRLKRLLDKRCFEEALAFAAKHGLSPNVVYLGLVRMHQDDIQSTLDERDGKYDDATFDAMMECIEKLSGDDEVGDLCLSALMLAKQYRHVERVLNFLEGQTITDEVTSREIASFRYELGTYRLLFGIGKEASYSADSPWPAFIENRFHHAYFAEFCRSGYIAGARVLWSRYPGEIIPQLAGSIESIEKLLSDFKECITAAPSTSDEVAEFFESELVATLLFAAPPTMLKIIGEKVLAFFTEIPLLLEKIECEKFPLNSLWFANTLRRAVRKVKDNARTPDQHVNAIYVMKVLDLESVEETTTAGQLNRMALGLEEVEKLARVNQCPMSYAEYVASTFQESTIETICYRILDHTRTARSVSEHVKKYAFPYMAEHKLDQNEILYSFIRRLSDTYYRGRLKYSDNTWDHLCLQLITECISDQNLKCRAVIEVCAGAVPPWSTQLTKVVDSTLGNEKIDPKLLERLRLECTASELSRILISYQIPVEARSRLLGASSISCLLKFIYKSSDKEMCEKLNDSLKVIEIYEKLKGVRLMKSIDCYFLYAVVLVEQMESEEETQHLVDLFQQIRTDEERALVARRLAYHYLKSNLRQSVNQKVKSRRLRWISALLCVAERYLPKSEKETSTLIGQARKLRSLQVSYGIIVGFDALEKREEGVQLLASFIRSKTNGQAPTARKSIAEIATFGRLLALNADTIAETAILIQIEEGYLEDALRSLAYLIEENGTPNVNHLSVSLKACNSTLWAITDAALKSGSEIGPLRGIVQLLKEVLPELVERATILQSTQHFLRFSQIARYVALLSTLLDQAGPIERESPNAIGNRTNSPCSPSKDSMNIADLNPLLTYHRRLGTYTAGEERTFFDYQNAVHCMEVVAASVVDLPVEGEEEVARFHSEMREAWQRLFVSVSSHLFLELWSRNLAQSLACFAGSRELAATQPQHVMEILKKILTPPVADICLAAHILLSLEKETDRMPILQDLRRWAISRKNVRSTLNLVRVSLFVLTAGCSSDYGLQRQIATWFETTLWQKRMLKCGVVLTTGQLGREKALELVPEWVKALVPPSTVRRYCEDLHVNNVNTVLFAYAVELCRLPPVDGQQSFPLPSTRLAKASLQEVVPDEELGAGILKVIEELCPYNYEAIGLLLGQLNQWILQRGICTNLRSFVKEALILLDFMSKKQLFLLILRTSGREGGFMREEVRWYRKRITSKNTDAEVSTFVSTFDESNFNLQDASSASGHLAANLYKKTEMLDANLPPAAAKRLPFHLFARLRENDASFIAPTEDGGHFKNVLLPVLTNEVNIYNYQRWSALLTVLPLTLKYSRTMLLVNTICVALNDAITYRRELSDDDQNQIRELISSSSNRISLLKGLANRFRKLPLCPLKVSIFKLSCELLSEWLETEGSVIAAGGASDEGCASLSALPSSLAKYKTDLLLERNGVLDPDTASMGDARQLILHLCSDVDWGHLKSAEGSLRIVEQIAAIHSLRLEEVFDDLVNSWLPGSGMGDSEGPQSDPDATIDFTSYASTQAVSSCAEQELSPAMIYTEPKITRIVFILRKYFTAEAMLEKARAMGHQLEQDVAVVSGGYASKIRMACCLIRCLDNNQLLDTFKIDIDQFCGRLVTLLNQRLLSICRMDFTIKEFKTMDKLELVRNILSPRSLHRQTPEVAHLLVALLIDNQLNELDLVEKTAQRLVHLRMAKLLIALLKFARSAYSLDLPKLAELPNYYAKAFEWTLGESGFARGQLNEENCAELATMVFFLLGCPVEGGPSFSRSRAVLSDLGATNSSDAVALSASSIMRLDKRDGGDRRKTTFDLRLSVQHV